MGTSIEIKDNSDKVLDEFEDAMLRALEAVGSQAEGHAVLYETAVDTSRLKNSITHAIEGKDTVAIGTNVEYAAYVELGTGIYAEKGGRTTPWHYKDEDGNWHYTRGQKPIHFLKKAIMNHIDEYKALAIQALKGF